MPVSQNSLLVKKWLIWCFISFIGLTFELSAKAFDPAAMDKILYGVAYYYEYMPVERLTTDARLMQACGINVVRICESTWAYLEPQEGVFNLDYVGRILEVMHQHQIQVIVGTPTYAIPSWLAKKYPEILATTPGGKNQYGSRQNMDLTHPAYRFYAERIIRKLIRYVCQHPAVIGYQIDNETKHYQTQGENVQIQFVKYLKTKFKSPAEMTQAYGLNYWSNSVFAWEDLPSTAGAVNASLIQAFKTFQRGLVTEFLAWQAAIVNEYKKPGQFITHNFDLSWRNGSHAIQPDVDHFEACRPLDMVGIDVYHRTQDQLDGVTIALAGDLARSLKRTNYLVMETQAQSILSSALQQLPYPRQLRLQAFSHLASGANMIAYWPWHSIHNSVETYWKGILSHDLEPNPTYWEAQKIAADFKRLGSRIMNLKKSNQIAIYFSNESLTALEWFAFSPHLQYNDMLRELYTILYKLNLECDLIDHTCESLEAYRLIIVPPLYVATDAELVRLNQFVEQGGHIIYAFKSGFCNEHVQVRTARMPAVLRTAGGFSYQQFTNIDTLGLKDNPFQELPAENLVSVWAELLVSETASVLAYYRHPHWGKYAAITRNHYGKGTVTYFGAWPATAILKKLILNTCEIAGLSPRLEYQFPLIVRQGVNKAGKTIHFFLNYSANELNFQYQFASGAELLSGRTVKQSDPVPIKPWECLIVECNE